MIRSKLIKVGCLLSALSYAQIAYAINNNESQEQALTDQIINTTSLPEAVQLLDSHLKLLNCTLNSKLTITASSKNADAIGKKLAELGAPEPHTQLSYALSNDKRIYICADVAQYIDSLKSNTTTSNETTKPAQASTTNILPVTTPNTPTTTQAATKAAIPAENSTKTTSTNSLSQPAANKSPAPTSPIAKKETQVEKINALNTETSAQPKTKAEAPVKNMIKLNPTSNSQTPPIDNKGTSLAKDNANKKDTATGNNTHDKSEELPSHK